MATSVPNIEGIKLSDVLAVISTSGQNLADCFGLSYDVCFNATYKGSKDRLSNFRDYNLARLQTLSVDKTSLYFGAIPPNPCYTGSDVINITASAGNNWTATYSGSKAINMNGSSSTTCTGTGNGSITVTMAKGVDAGIIGTITITSGAVATPVIDVYQHTC